jgi:hypothetical protein
MEKRNLLLAVWAASCTLDHYDGNGLYASFRIDGVQTPTPAWWQNPGTAVTCNHTSGGYVLRRFELFEAAGDSFQVGCQWRD